MARDLPIQKFGNVERRTFSKIREVQPIPYLIEIQRDSCDDIITIVYKIRYINQEM